jgi:hypothetical protein
MRYEQGTPDVGLASADQGARAQDASAVFTKMRVSALNTRGRGKGERR